VEYGLLSRQVSGVEAVRVDEIHWGHGKKADNFLTVIYQIDAGYKRLLWIGKRRAAKTLRLGLKELGPEFVEGLEFYLPLETLHPSTEISGELDDVADTPAIRGAPLLVAGAFEVSEEVACPHAEL
jgi:hypothetical protein